MAFKPNDRGHGHFYGIVHTWYICASFLEKQYCQKEFLTFFYKKLIFHFLSFSFLFGKNTTTGGCRHKPPVVAANAGCYLKEPSVVAAKAGGYLKEQPVVAFSIFFSFLFF